MFRVLVSVPCFCSLFNLKLFGMKRKVVFRIGKGKEEVEKVRWRLPEGKKQREEEEERELDFCFFTSLFYHLLF